MHFKQNEINWRNVFEKEDHIYSSDGGYLGKVVKESESDSLADSLFQIETINMAKGGYLTEQFSKFVKSMFEQNQRVFTIR